MSAPPSSRSPLRLDDVLPLLPDVDALRPVLEHLMAGSRPDPERRWTASGELGTAGGRLVDASGLREDVGALVAAEARRLERRFGRIADVVEALAAGRADAVVDVLLDESGALEQEGMATEARMWAEAALRHARQNGHPRTAEALRRTARCARAAGRLEEAADLYGQAFARARDEARAVDAVVAATGRGNVAVDRGRWAEAETWYGRGLAVLEPGATPGLGPEEARALRWRIFQNLGITHRERGVLDEAAAWYERAEAESAGLGDLAARIEVTNGRGQLDLARGAPRAAELRFRTALEALDERGLPADPVRVAVRVNLGEALLRQGRSLEAGESAREAEAEALRGRFLGRLPETYRLLARVARARGEGEGFVFLDRALELIRAHGLPAVEEALTLEAYAELRAEQGESESARDARARAREIFRALGVSRPGAPGDHGEQDGSPTRHDETRTDDERSGGAS